MPTKPKYCFVAMIFPQKTAGTSGEIRIEVLEYEPDGYNSFSNHKLCQFNWRVQTLPDRRYSETPLGVFGFDAEIEAKYLEHFEASVRVVRRILKKLEYSKKPEDVISALLAIGAIEVVSDRRESQLMPLADVKGPEYLDYIDDYRKLGNEHVTFGAMATSEIEAKALILTEATGSRHGGPEWCQKFVDHGLPVTVNQHSSHPNTTPAIERLKEVGLIKEDNHDD